MTPRSILFRFTAIGAMAALGGCAAEGPGSGDARVIVPGALPNAREHVSRATKARGLVPFFEPGQKAETRSAEEALLAWVRENRETFTDDESAPLEISRPQLFTYCHWPVQEGLAHSITAVAVCYYDVRPENRVPSLDRFPIVWVWCVDGKPLGYHFDSYGPRYDADQHTTQAYYLVRRGGRMVLVSNNAGWCGADAFEVDMNPLRAGRRLAQFEAREGNMASFYFAVGPGEAAVWAMIDGKPAIDYVPELRDFARGAGLPVVLAQVIDTQRGDVLELARCTLPDATVTKQTIDRKRGTCTRCLSGSWIETWDLTTGTLLTAGPPPHRILARIARDGENAEKGQAISPPNK